MISGSGVCGCKRLHRHTALINGPHHNSCVRGQRGSACERHAAQLRASVHEGGLVQLVCRVDNDSDQNIHGRRMVHLRHGTHGCGGHVNSRQEGGRCHDSSGGQGAALGHPSHARVKQHRTTVCEHRHDASGGEWICGAGPTHTCTRVAGTVKVVIVTQSTAGKCTRRSCVGRQRNKSESNKSQNSHAQHKPDPIQRSRPRRDDRRGTTSSQRSQPW